MKTGGLLSLSSPYSNSLNLKNLSSFKSASKTKDFLSGPPSDRDSISGKSRRSRIRKGSNGSIKVAKTMSKKLDFTNLAYREAVGRLKFLLEDSYAPSIKTSSQYRKHYPDDSGEDTDNQSQITDRPPLSEISKYLSSNYKTPPSAKKTSKSFSPYRSSRYSTNTEYAPLAPPTSAQPAPQPVVVGAPSSEVGQAPPEIISFIEKQEDYIEQLEKESKFCRDELSNLLGKVRDVISENEALTEHVRSDYGVHHTKISGSSESEDNRYEKILRGRKDKPTKTSQPLSGPSIVFESRISELEAELAQANIDLKKLRNENSDLKRKSSTGGGIETGSVESYRKRIEDLERDKISHEETIKRLQHTIENLRAEGSQTASKTQRSRDLADMAMFEKSQAEIEIRRMKEELERQHERVRELQHEMTRRIAEERSNAERRYNYHVDQLDGDLSSQWEHASKLQLELERHKRFESDYKRDLAQRNAQIDELKQELKDKKTTYLTDLAQANAEKQALEQEITLLRLQLDKSERQAKIEAGRLNAEINSLRQRLDRADAELLQARRENLRLNDDIANLEKDIALGELKGEIRPTTKDINKSIVEMEKKHAETVTELEDMIQSQRQLMDKLTTECRALTGKHIRWKNEYDSACKYEWPSMPRCRFLMSPPSTPDVDFLANAPDQNCYTTVGGRCTECTTLFAACEETIVPDNSDVQASQPLEEFSKNNGTTPSETEKLTQAHAQTDDCRDVKPKPFRLNVNVKLILKPKIKKNENTSSNSAWEFDSLTFLSHTYFETTIYTLGYSEEKKELRKTNDMLMERLKQIWTSYKELNPSVAATIQSSSSIDCDESIVALCGDNKLPSITHHQHSTPMQPNSPHPSTMMHQPGTIHPPPSLVQTTNIHQLMIVPSPGQHQHQPTFTPVAATTTTDPVKRKNQHLSRNTLLNHHYPETTPQNSTTTNLTPVSRAANSLNMTNSPVPVNSTPTSNNTINQTTTNPMSPHSMETLITAEVMNSNPTTRPNMKDHNSTATTTQPTSTKPTNRRLIYTTATANSPAAMIPHQSLQRQHDNRLRQQAAHFPLSHHPFNQLPDYNPIQPRQVHHQSQHQQSLHQSPPDELPVADLSAATSKALVNREKAETLWGRQLHETDRIEERNLCHNSLPRRLNGCQLHPAEIKQSLTHDDIDPCDLIPDFEVSSPSLFERSSDDDDDDMESINTEDTLERTIIINEL